MVSAPASLLQTWAFCSCQADPRIREGICTSLPVGICPCVLCLECPSSSLFFQGSSLLRLFQAALLAPSSLASACHALRAVALLLEPPSLACVPLIHQSLSRPQASPSCLPCLVFCPLRQPWAPRDDSACLCRPQRTQRPSASCFTVIESSCVSPIGDIQSQAGTLCNLLSEALKSLLLFHCADEETMPGGGRVAFPGLRSQSGWCWDQSLSEAKGLTFLLPERSWPGGSGARAEPAPGGRHLSSAGP